ncbi:rod-binding protein [Lachnospiraceae bacterium 29-84]
MSLEVGGINSYFNYNTDTATATTSTSKLEDTLKNDLSGATDDELMSVCKDFESYFIEQMFKAMQKMVPDSGQDTSASTKQLQEFYKEQMVQSFAEQSTEGGGLGIAQVLYEQMKRNYGL